MERIAVEYFSISIDPGSNQKSIFHSYMSGENKQDAYDSHAHMFHLLKKLNQEYKSLICQQDGKTPMVVSIIICVL